MPWLVKTPLRHAQIQLEPLHIAHTQALTNVLSAHPERFLGFQLPNISDVNRYLLQKIQCTQHEQLALSIREHMTGRILGFTCLSKVDLQRRKIVMGDTWLDHPSSYLLFKQVQSALLSYLFEEQHAEIVEYRVPDFDHKVREHVQSLGAHFDGVLRHNQKLEDGSMCDSAVYSILFKEWADCKLILEQASLNKLHELSKLSHY